MPARKIPLDVEALTKMYVDKRMTIRAIAAAFDCRSGSSVLRTLRQLGITRPERKPAECKMSQLREMQALYGRGHSTKEIAKRYGFSESYVGVLLRESGMLMRRSGRTSVSVVCKIPNCTELVQMVKQHGVYTGTMCVNHRRQYDADRARASYRKQHNLTPDKFRHTKWQRGETPCD
jgi:hypothetical protein